MFTTPLIRPVLAAVPLAFFGATLAVAQPCQPAWDGAIGNPGLSSGYAAAIAAWNDGNGESLYVGGSFDGIIGVGNTKLVARWDKDNNSWSGLGSGLSTGFTNGFLTSILPFKVGGVEELIVAGFFAEAVGVPGTKSIARWDGQSWKATGANFNPTAAESVWAMTKWSGVGGERLYVGGAFPLAGGVTAGGLAAWDGTQWYSLGVGIAGPFSPTVFKLISFNDGGGDQLYAMGRFTSVDGVSAPLIARWNGTNWSTVGGGLSALSSLASLESAAVFDDGNGAALYVGGSNFSVPGLGAASVAKWNGQNWSIVGQNVGGRVTSLAVFDDGGGKKLYLGGTATPSINYIARLENGQWVTVDGGVTGPAIPPSTFPSVFGLGVWGDSLYVGGNFTQVGTVAAGGIARRKGCAAPCVGDLDGDGVVGQSDLGLLLGAYGKCPGDPGYVAAAGLLAPANPCVDQADLGLLLGEYGKVCP